MKGHKSTRRASLSLKGASWMWTAVDCESLMYFKIVIVRISAHDRGYNSRGVGNGGDYKM